MYDEFREAPVLGSLLNPAAADAAKLVDWPVLSTVLADALAGEESDERRETAVAARGLVRAAELLSKQYHWVITNVPYLARGKQGESLRRFSERQYPTAKNDLATVFLERCLGLCAEGGTASLVLPQNWLFLTGYRKLREKLLKTQNLAFARQARRRRLRVFGGGRSIRCAPNLESWSSLQWFGR